ncbi:DUF3089 domain-containing protein [Pseudodesulfovibrio sp. zrk46]|uniref:DUF3089 domain-containing protein n=1 Tax=Pseudodesulfovibrio sp. zrk46 TaxID=2725288 RepID=UPI0014490143|nr:DUF3089 domain-containing protein [Pseudodesulfovibrio sp. zrk46]QJB56262.1 DUF3089 domain-containing protein [Pseudodesulfovibrio sp. zrk46]
MIHLPTLYSAVALAVALFLYAAPASAKDQMPPFDVTNVPPELNYSEDAAWLALPTGELKHNVDIFWVYPTVLFDKQHWLMPPSDAALQAAAKNTLRTQASVFSGQANLFAPYYRQMNLAALALPEKDVDELFAYGKADVLEAFRYYLTHLNQGRPFILAGHSQGSNILVDMARDYWGTFGAEDRMIAAYTIGWSITLADIKQNPKLTICESAEQTGCFITYNTVAPGRQAVAPTLKPDTYVVNPLTWTTDNSIAPASLNNGAVFFSDDGTQKSVANYTDAQIVDHGLVINPDDKTYLAIEGGAFPEGVYHFFDYSLFYDNIRENAGQRIRAFLSQ